MENPDRLCVTDGLKADDIIIFTLDCQTMLIIRPNEPDNPSQGYRTVHWSNGNDKKLVQCISDRGSFLEFVMLVAETHGLYPNVVERSDNRLSLVLAKK